MFGISSLGMAGHHPAFVDRFTAKHIGDLGHATEFFRIGRDDAAGQGFRSFGDDPVTDQTTDPADLTVALGEATEQKTAARRTVRRDLGPTIGSDGDHLPPLGGGGKTDDGQQEEEDRTA
jgi:hypothetical protein